MKKIPLLHVEYTQEEIQQRFQDWARLPAIDSTHFVARNIAWHRYCDARDGYPEGTSERRYQSVIHETGESRQMDMFSRRYQS